MKIIITFCVFSLVLAFVCADFGYPQPFSDAVIRSLPDSSFVLVEIDKNGKRVQHFPYKDAMGRIDPDQLIYCLGTLAGETWVDPENEEIARKHLEECYNRLKYRRSQDEFQGSVNINTAHLQELVCLPGVGPVSAVRIYRFRKVQGLFKSIKDIGKVKGIGASTYAGIKHYINVDN